MSDAAITPEGAAGAEPKPRSRRLLLLAVVPLLLGGVGAGLWFGGILPPLLGAGAPPPAAMPAAETPRPPAFVELPEIIANLNAPGRRPVFVRLRARIEIARAEDTAAIQAAMPRLLDLFQTYLREMRPEELRGSIGTQRLREELILRANLAAPPARVTDILFTEILMQ
ncbi:MAG TPA: flagellar basal body-associated FliL family protein [Acetobacteraceae bacterium]|nr:flagellar basal body-associated FliL family protein [Acetobacteraceae bacterium]